MSLILRAARLCSLALCLSSPFLFLFSLPWIDLGVWRQVETANVAMHAVAAAMAALLAVRVACREPAAASAVRRPFVLAAAALGVLSLGLLPFAGDAALSFHGLPKHGVGALWHLDLAVMAASFVAAGVRGQRWCAVSAILAVVSVMAVNLTGIGNGPYAFPGYMAFLGIFAGVALAAAWNRKAATALATAVALLAIAQSGNKSAMAFALLAGGAFAWRLAAPGLVPGRRVTAAALVTAAVAWLAFLPVVGTAIEAGAVAAMKPVSGVASDTPADHVNIPHIPLAGTVWERAQMARVVFHGLASHPERLLHGAGWGSFPETVAQERALVPGRRFETDIPTAARSFWDAQYEADFHSHNIFLEALNSGGAGAFALTLLLAAAPVLSARRRARGAALVLSLSLAVIGSFWFILTIATPFLALAAATVTPATAGGRRLPRAGRAGASAALGLHAVAALFSASMMLAVANLEWEERHYSPIPPFAAVNCGGIRSLFVPERTVNADLYWRMLAFAAEQKGETPAAFINERALNLKDYSCTMRRYIADAPSASVLSASLQAREVVTALTPNQAPVMMAIGDDVTRWRSDIGLMLALAPGRTDVVVPYAEFLARLGAKEKLASLAPLADAMPESDPVRHWLRGRIAQASGGNGTAELGRALSLGIDNIKPIPPAQADAIRQGGQ